MMKRTVLAAFAVAVVGLFGPASADAQDRPDYRFDLGINGGFAWYSDMLDDSHFGEDAEDVKFESGWILGAQATYWATPRVGIRANGTFTDRPVVLGSYDELDASNAETDLVQDINLWSLTGDVLFRLAPDGYAMGNIWSRPYLALGFGAKNVNPAGDVVLNPGGEEEYTGYYFGVPGQPGVAIVEEWQMMGLAALGTDVRLADNFGLRIELGDRIWDAPLRSAPEFAADAEEDYGKVQHELYAQLGAHLLMGLEEPEVVAVEPAPPAPRMPEPEPEPVEERITVCVIDPANEAGIRTVNAIYLPETRDTMVVVNGQRRAIGGTLPNVMLANEADWFVRGEPLAITLAEDYTLEYTTWQSARMIDADELTYLGTVRGLPVYAASDDVTDVEAQLREVRRAEMTNDLDEILEQREDLRAQVEEVQYLYVPLRPTGCVFQTVRQVEQVRKKDG